MKIIAQPIDTITWSKKNGEVRPLKFKWESDELSEVIKVDRIIKVEKTQRAGDHAYVYTCESTIKGIRRLYELRYSLASCIWVLYKI